MLDDGTNNSMLLKRQILLACERVSLRLSALSGIDIKVTLSTVDDLHEAHNDWQPRPFDWLGDSFQESEYFCNFRLSVHGEQQLCAVRKICFEKEEKALILNHVRGNPDHDNPLRGLILDVFSEAALEIAKSIEAKEIIIDRARPEIKPIYQSLGFSRRHHPQHLGLYVDQNTQLNPRVFAL